MKNLLNDFDIKHALKIISEEGMNALLKAAGIDLEAAESVKKSAKTRKHRLEALAEFIENQEPSAAQFFYCALRVAYFFHKHREAFTGLHAYLAHASGVVPRDGLPEECPVGDQVVRLYLNHPREAHEYFIISLFTEQSKRYHQHVPRHIRGRYFRASL